MAKMRCPRCGSDDVRRYYDELKCDRCDESFGPKCDSCGDQMTSRGSTWECPTCHGEVDSDNIEVKGVSKSSGSGFLGSLFDAIFH